jgi:probable rRNA maturation factor
MNENINFFFEDLAEPNLDYKKITVWLSSLIKKQGYALNEINYILCSDKYLLGVNQEYLNHDYYTDIITFDNAEEEKTIESDIFVSVERVEDNAKEHKETFDNEIIRVLAHGVLHLLGFKDKSEEEATEMRKQEELAIKLYLDTE